jgi:HSP20 family molecular chaperone IbpA
VLRRRQEMTTAARRHSNPLTEMLSWFDTDTPFRADGTSLVRIEDYVEDDTYVLRAEVPGVDPEKDLEVSVADDVVSIRGHRREEEKDKGHHEIRYGEFVRSVRLPQRSRVDDVKATYDDGVLEVRVPVDSDGNPKHAVPITRKAG